MSQLGRFKVASPFHSRHHHASPHLHVGVRMPRHLVFFLTAACVLWTGCSHIHVEPSRRDAPFEPVKTTHLRLILVGDTGHPSEDMTRVRRAIKAEKKDAIVALGDLVYPLMPACPTGVADGEALKELDAKLGGALSGLGAPVFLVVGNHDIPRGVSKSAREACLIDYAAQRDDLVLPRLSHAVDFGVAILGIANTQNPQDAEAKRLASALRSHRGWRIGVGHHVYKTHRDKVTEDVVRPWLRRHQIPVDIWANGHAHLLQLGLYDGVVAITSGTASLRRTLKTCPPACGPGEIFGASDAGYALLELWPDRLQVTFKNHEGTTLHRWNHTRPAR